MLDSEATPFLDERSGWRCWRQAWSVSFLVWTGLWLLLLGPSMGEDWAGPKLPGLVAYLSDFWVTAALSPLFLFVAWRLPLDRRRWRRSLPLLALTMMVFAAADDAACQLLRLVLDRWLGNVQLLSCCSAGKLLALYLHTIFNYMQIAAVGWAIHFQREARLRTLGESQLAARLAEARLAVLRMQLQPHFLFNTLNSIAALMHRDADAADRMIARLAELLRQSLETAGHQEVPLKTELETLERYLAIEQVRFADRLEVRQRVDPETLSALVPSLLLQPIVENAVRHGIAQRTGPGRIELQAQRVGDELCLRVSDDGPGWAGNGSGMERTGIGLSNTRERLDQLYAERQRLQIESEPNGGTAVVIHIPFRPAPAEPEAGPANATLAAGS